MKKINLTLVGTVVLIVLAGASFWFIQNKRQAEVAGQQAKTKEGKEQQATSLPTSNSLEALFANSQQSEFPKIDTSKWQEYRDVVSGVSFRMPNDWEVKSKNDENKYLCLGKKSKQYSYEGEKACGIAVSQANGLSQWEGLEDSENYQRWQESFQVTKYRVTVNNQEALFWKGSGFLITSIPLVTRNMRQEVRLDYNGESMQEEESVYYGIAQTLSIQ